MLKGRTVLHSGLYGLCNSVRWCLFNGGILLVVAQLLSYFPKVISSFILRASFFLLPQSSTLINKLPIKRSAVVSKASLRRVVKFLLCSELLTMEVQVLNWAYIFKIVVGRILHHASIHSSTSNCVLSDLLIKIEAGLPRPWSFFVLHYMLAVSFLG